MLFIPGDRRWIILRSWMALPVPIHTDIGGLSCDPGWLCPSQFIRIYNEGSVVAEKFEAIVKLASFTSRYTDLYDIWTLSRRFEFDGNRLSEAIRKTFGRRGTEIPENPQPLEEEFYGDRERKKFGPLFLEETALRMRRPILKRSMNISLIFCFPSVNYCSNRLASPKPGRRPGPGSLYKLPPVSGNAAFVSR